jgi:hypothetical protein
MLPITQTDDKNRARRNDRRQTFNSKLKELRDVSSNWSVHFVKSQESALSFHERKRCVFRGVPICRSPLVIHTILQLIPASTDSGRGSTIRTLDDAILAIRQLNNGTSGLQSAYYAGFSLLWELTATCASFVCEVAFQCR